MADQAESRTAVPMHLESADYQRGADLARAFLAGNLLWPLRKEQIPVVRDLINDLRSGALARARARERLPRFTADEARGFVDSILGSSPR